MNSKLIVTGAGLFGLGALVGWALTADHYENVMKEHAKVVDEVMTRQELTIRELTTSRVLDSMEPAGWVDPTAEAVAAASDTVLDLSEPAENESQSEEVAESELEISPGGDSDEDELMDEEMWDEIPQEPVEETKSRLMKLIEEYGMNEEDRDPFVAKAVKRLPYDGTPPFVISQQDFAADDIGESYDKITLTWYDRDRVLVDELEDPISYQEYIGVQCLSEFGGAGDDPDTVFVRNHRLLTDFEVIRVEDPLPIHIRYDIGKDEFKSRVAAGTIQLRDEDL